jgi:RNase P subunit RPR2
MKKTSKTDTKEKIDRFFAHIKGKTPEDVKKIKRLAMKYKIRLGDKRKLFCKKCYNPFGNSSINFKNGFMNIVCDKCGHKSRWKLKQELDLGIKYHEHDADACC